MAKAVKDTKRKPLSESDRVPKPINPALANFARLLRAAADAHRAAEARIADEAQQGSRKQAH